MPQVKVDLDAGGYVVFIGAGMVRELGSLLPTSARRAAIVTQSCIPVEVDCGIEQRSFLIGTGEEEKCLATIEELCRGFASWGLTRSDVVIAVGGGMVTDVAGFAASCYHRGVPVVHVSTTLLGQIDAAIGGKTGVNIPEGKNLLGAYWQPRAVICDTDHLGSLPPEEYRSGLGEMAKYHFLGGADLSDLSFVDKVVRCVEIKADVVSADEREGGLRATLNYGHTLGHAIETSGGYDLRHGEAVAVGLCFAAHLAARLGRINSDRVQEHHRVVTGYGLSDRLPEGLDPATLVAIMHRDKKAVSGLTFALDGPRGVTVESGIDEVDVLDTLEEFARR